MIQDEIVRILDLMSESTNEIVNKLSEEYNLRNNQYNYYKDKLLTFKEAKI